MSQANRAETGADTGPYSERDEAAVKDLQSSVVATYDAPHLARSLNAIATWTIPLNDPLGRAVLREAAARVESVANLLERLDEYAALRERVSHLSDADDAPTQRMVLDEAVQAWHRLLAARSVFSSDPGANR